MTTGRISEFWETRGSRLALVGVATLFGMQLLRVLFPTIVHVLGDRFEVSNISLGLVAFLPFLAAFLAGAIWRFLGPRGGLILAAAGLGIARLVEQASGDPVFDFAISAIGVALFMVFFPIYLGTVKGEGSDQSAAMGLAVLVGLAVDGGIHGLLGSYDLSWQPGPAGLILIALMFVLLLAGLRSATSRHMERDGDAPWGVTWPLLAIGSLLFLEALIFQNPAQLSALTGWILPTAFLWVMVVNLAGIAASVWVMEAGWFRRGWLALVLGVGLVAALFLWPTTGVAAAAGLLVGHVAAATIFVGILGSAESLEPRPGLSRTTLGFGLGAVILVALSFAYYIAFQLPVPYENTVVPVVAGVVVAVAGLGASFQMARRQATGSLGRAAVWIAAALLVLPFFSLAAWRTPVPRRGDGWPIRVMTYNLHMGFDTDGRLGLEALAEVMEENGADVLALQEVSRGWLINGSADMLSWLSQRLGMSYVWNPTADPLWGNAIFSRFPIRSEGTAPLPREGVPLKRGYAWARIDIGEGENLLFIATHLHHVEAEGHVRRAQVPPILAFWGGAERSLILGDLNAEPDAPEIARIRDAGLVDAFAASGAGDGYTFSSFRPERRIDYIWISHDLIPSDLVIPQSTASDHLGVVATVDH